MTTCCTRAISTDRFPGFETDIHGLRFEPDCRRTGAIWSTVLREESDAMIPRDVKAPDDSDSLPQAAQGRRDRRRGGSADQAAARPHRRRELRSRGQRQLRSRRLRGRLGRRLHRAGRRRPPRAGAQVRARGSGDRLPTPLWALADSHRIADLAVLGADRRGRRLRLPRPADARLLRQAGRRQPGQVRHDACCRPSSAG